MYSGNQYHPEELGVVLDELLKISIQCILWLCGITQKSWDL